MKKNRKQWMKYAAVVLAFVVMAGFFMPENKAEVRATETGSTVSGGNVETQEPVMTIADSWRVVVSFETNGGVFSEEAKIHFPDGGNIYMTQTTDSGGETPIAVAIPSDLKPTREGYVFRGWSCNIDSKDYQPGETTAEFKYSDENILFTAKWEALKNVTIKYDANGGIYDSVLEEPYQQVEGENEITIKFSDDIMPSLENHEFSGWLCSLNNTVYTLNEPEAVFKWEDIADGQVITFTAQWKENPYVTILYKSDETIVAEEKRYQTELEEIIIDFTLDCFQKDPESPGYLFDGWKCDLDGKVYSKANPAVMKWNDINASQIVFTMQWVWDGKSITESGKEYALKAGTPYTLNMGTWKVNDDGYSYTGGSTFYVGSDGNYTFTDN